MRPSFINTDAPGMPGASPDGEPRFLNAVTGQGISFTDGMETGRRIRNLDRAVLALQGRHRNTEVLSNLEDFTHKLAGSLVGGTPGVVATQTPVPGCAGTCNVNVIPRIGIEKGSLATGRLGSAEDMCL